MAERTMESYITDIVRESGTLIDFMSANGYYLPSFENGGFKDYPDLPDDVVESQRRLARAAQAVSDLASGPKQHLRSLSRSYLNNATLHWLVHFRIPDVIPLHGAISYAQVAQACDVEETQLRRVLRHAMLQHLFAEPSPEDVAHTPFSAALVTDPALRSWVDFCCEDGFPASARLVAATERWGGSEDPSQAAYRMASPVGLSFWETLREKPGVRDRYIGSLSAADKAIGFELKHVVQGYSWQRVKLVVDVGGSTGELAVALARAYPSLRIIVEDFPDVVAKAQSTLSDDVKENIVFVGHDYTTAQPVKVSGAQVYLLRNVLHNHPDPVAAQILKSLLGFLKDGAKLLIIDTVIEMRGSAGLGFERQARDSDIELMSLWSSRERRLDQWVGLFKLADPDLAVLSVSRPPQSTLSIIEVAFHG